MDAAPDETPTLRDRARAALSGDEGRQRLALVLFVAVLVAGGAARVLACGEGLPYIHGWDEPYTARPALTILKTGAWNHGSFNYGSLLIYLNAFVDVVHYFWLMAQSSEPPLGLRNLDQLLVPEPNEYIWQVSHPSFYLWNRWLNAAFGLGTIAITGWLGREAGGRWAGVAAAALMASTPLHVDLSAQVVNDVPGGMLFVATTALAWRFLRDSDPRVLVASLATAGLAAGTKYNMGVAWVIPAVALIHAALTRAPGYRNWLWLAVAAVPVVAFLASTPYALFDTHRWLNGAGFEVRHYAVTGHHAMTVDRGVPHLALQVGRMLAQVTVPGGAVAALGLTGLVLRRFSPVFWAGPLAYAAVMSGTLVGFHRNWLVLYPYVAVAFGVGTVMVVRRIAAWSGSRPSGTPWGHVAAGAVLALLGLRLGWEVVDGWSQWRGQETRSHAMQVVRETAIDEGWYRIGVAREAQFHASELQVLPIDYQVLPSIDLLCGRGPRVVLVGQAYDHTRGDGARKALALRLAEWPDAGRELWSIDGGPIMLGTVSRNPGLRLLTDLTPPADCADDLLPVEPPEWALDPQ